MPIPPSRNWTTSSPADHTSKADTASTRPADSAAQSKQVKPTSPARPTLANTALGLLQAKTKTRGTNTPHKEPRSVTQLSPSLIAKFGCEIEIPGVSVHPPLPRGAVLIERPLWKLETDNAAHGNSDIEFVFQPLSDQSQVETAMKEIMELINALREHAVAGDTSVALHAVAPDAKNRATLKIDDARFGARLQSTYGISLEGIQQAMDELLPREQTDRIHGNTAAISNSYTYSTGENLSADAKGFINLINLYLVRAQGRRQPEGTVHAYFRIMARSDFCSIYQQLLNTPDRAALATLLVTPEAEAEGQVPMLMKAIGLDDPDAKIFARPYNLPGTNPEPLSAGPTIKAWLQSIVEGRGEGQFQKDLLSPPDGYPLHSGDLAIDYGMGAMGVDAENKLLLVELRGAPYRPETIPMNGQIARAVHNELGHAGVFNKSLAMPNHETSVSAKFQLLNQCESLYFGLATIQQSIESNRSKLNSTTWKLLSRSLDRYGRDSASICHDVGARTDSAWAPALMLSMGKLKSSIDVLLTEGDRAAGPSGALPHLPAFKEALIDYEKTLWAAGKMNK